MEDREESTGLDCISKERLAGMLHDYITNDAEGVEDSAYISGVLRDLLGMTEEEAEILGLTEYLMYEEDEDDG